MDAADFKKDFLDSVKAGSATTGEGSCACFVEDAATYLVDNQLLPDYIPCYYSGEYKRKKYRVDGYAFDDFDGTMNLIIADYDGIDINRTLTNTSAMQLFKNLTVFADAAIHSDLCETIDISTSASDLVNLLKSNFAMNIRKFRMFLFTDANTSGRIKNIDTEDFFGKPVESQIWDLSRLFEVCTAPEVENIEINFKDYGIEGIPCIKANVGEEQKYDSYLGVIPGKVLADIYDKYGSRLLEGNVRSFLSTKVAVNKKIRETIINQPEMFFAFNNGISVTAEDVIIENNKGRQYIVSARDFQIINGGQTTASLYNARRNNKADLDSIYVQMKLTEIDDETSPEETDDLIREISRSSNSQNKVSDADFFASHPFHRQMEQISKVTYAPAVHGAQYETLWFYERARGQYLQEQMRLTAAKKNAFLLKNPKNQLIKKTDLAKVQNTWLEHPDTVSKGAQANFIQFANYIDEQWQINDSQFNERYYQTTAALMIMFSYLETVIPKESWYEGGYRANVVTYSIALLHRLIQKQFPGRDLDLIQIWNKQEVPDAIKKILKKVAAEVFYKLTDPDRPVMNVTQWCKRAQCWDGVQAINIDLPEEINEYLISTSDNYHEKKMANKDQNIIKGINAQVEVIKFSAEHWKRLAEFAVEKHLVTAIDVAALKMACQIPNKIPNSVQSQHLLDLESRARAEGFKSEDE